MKYKLLYIEWEDACDSDGTWWTPEQVIAFGKEDGVLYKTVGWLIFENDKRIVVASNMEYQGSSSKIAESERKIGHIFKIPKGWIRKRKILKL